MRLCLAAAYFVAMVYSLAARGADPPREVGGASRTAAAPAAERVAQLISELGSPSFSVREAASEELAQLGRPALAALQAATNHPDREVRYRSQRLVGLIRQQDQQRRLQAFLQGREEDSENPLPGWNRFRQRYGDDAQTRGLFVEMFRADPELLQAIEEGPRQAADVLTQRTVQVQQAAQLGAPQQPTLGQVVAGLFVAAEEDVSLPPQTLSTLFSQCFAPTVSEVISTGARREIPRKMLATIIRRSDDYAAYQAMNVATQFNMPEGIIPAAKILSGHGPNRSPHMAQYALMTVARLGDASHLALVESDRLLKDATPVAQFQENGVTYVVQLRDVALAASLVLRKANLREFFDIPPNQPLGDPQMIFLNARLIGFPSEAQRAALWEKWEKFKSQAATKP
jgi:hypothetical protein